MILFGGESMKFKSINPYTEEVNWTYDSFPIGECKSQIEKSRYAFLSWSSLSDARKKEVEPITYGGKPKKGFFFNPTIIPAASTDMDVCNVEVFGPIAPIITARDENDAVEIANSTEYGLGAKIWSGNLERAESWQKR
jgi:acyl-CoA reductase-like NAD-dependent aldehyde dehydrogenase